MLRAALLNGRQGYGCSVPDATGIQIATLVAASVSAVGSCIAGAAGYKKMRHESMAPAVELYHNEKAQAAVVVVRNRALTSRTVYSVGVQYLRTSNLRRYATLDPPECSGDCDVPLELAPGERAKWRIRYAVLAQKRRDCPWLYRRSFTIALELGEKRYAVRPDRILRRGMRKASQQASPKAEPHEKPVYGPPSGYM